MNKALLLKNILNRLSLDLGVLSAAAKTAHEASTHAENIPDNKYDTLALEASYVAQGQANRADQIRRSIEVFRQLQLNEDEDDIISVASLVTLQDSAGTIKILFIGPLEGGLKIEQEGEEIVVITLASPVGRVLLGRRAGDTVEILAGTMRVEYEIIKVS